MRARVEKVDVLGWTKSLKWWAEAAYVVHDNMWGYTRGEMSIGKNGQGLIINMLKKQNLNNKSSKEAELIRADNAMPQMLWTRYFLEAQSYGIDKNILYQDNMRAIVLEKNGNTSSTKNAKNINVRYYQARG